MLPYRSLYSQDQRYQQRVERTLAPMHSCEYLVPSSYDRHDDNLVYWIGDNILLNCVYLWIDGSEWNHNPPRYPVQKCQYDQPNLRIMSSKHNEYQINALYDFGNASSYRSICYDG